MYRTPAMHVKETVLPPPLTVTMQNVAGQLAHTSRKTYTVEAKHFARWMAEQRRSLFSLNRDDLVAYRTHLAETYAKSTASRMWAVARRLLDEAVQRGLLTRNPAEGIRGFKAGDDESPYRALKREEARSLPSYAARTRELRLSFARDGARREEGVSLCIIVSLQGGVT